MGPSQSRGTSLPTLKHKGCFEQIANRGRGAAPRACSGGTIEVSGAGEIAAMPPGADVKVVVSVATVKPAEGAV